MSSIINQAREFVHNTLQTEQERQAEKPLVDKIEESMPSNAAEAGASVGRSIDNTFQAVQDTPAHVQTTLSEVKERLDAVAHKFQDNLPNSAEDVGRSVGESIDRTVTSIQNNMPENAEDAGSSIGRAIDNAINNFKENFEKRLDEGTVREDKGFQPLQAMTNSLDTARVKLADATKSPEQVQLETFLDKPLVERIQEIHATKDEPAHPAALL
jgi:gas vesicle protein